MTTAQIEIDPAAVAHLIAEQFPGWAELPLTRVASAGTDNLLFRLGADLCVRLPRVAWAGGQVAKEARWLPMLAPHLSLAIPTPVAWGKPSSVYPWDWAVYDWLPGRNGIDSPPVDLHRAADDLAGFITRLHAVDATGGPPAGDHNFQRGMPLHVRDALVRTCIEQLGDLIDAPRVIELWEAALAAPAWNGPPVWVHGDIHPGNLLVEQGRIGAVIDFGGLGVGDPAVDLIVGWNLLEGPSRSRFRAELGVDDATWLRGQGWALSIALIAYPYYLESNPVIVANSRRVIEQIMIENYGAASGA